MSAVELRVKRLGYSASFPCEGGLAFYTDDDPKVGHHLGLIEGFPEVDALGEGSRIRVTVEVLEAKPIPNECKADWPSHRHRSDYVELDR